MDSLPEELLTSVLTFLSYDRPHVDIANCRLVSRRFRALSSPYLISTVVIADRWDTLQKLKEVLEHPYFSKYVTRLVWDASFYETSVVESLYAYHLQCEENPWQSSAIRKYRTSLQEAHAARIALLQSAVSQSRLAGPHENFDRRLDDDEQCDLSYPPGMPMRDLLRSGHDEYRRRFFAQLEIRRRGLSLRYLHSAFEMLPKLRHFEFSDFRALSRNGESMGELCERLFGETLSPDLLSDDQVSAGSEPWDNLDDCLRNLVKINPQLESLSFGRSEHSAWDALQCSASPRMFIPDMHPDDDEEQWRSLFGFIRHLSLPVDITTDGDEMALDLKAKNPRRILSYSAATLTHLRLETELYSGVWKDSWDPTTTAAPLFAKVFDQVHFHSLDTIVLRGWLIPLKDFENFLLAHATTLRNMHLINCCVAGASKDELMPCIRKKLAPALALTGVEIHSLAYEACGFERIGRSDCHDFEDAFLAGRCNGVMNREQKNKDREYREQFWDDRNLDNMNNEQSPFHDIDIEQSSFDERDMDEEGYPVARSLSPRLPSEYETESEDSLDYYLPRHRATRVRAQ
jgi:hypothetical protein